jgi:hypothetical protein
VLIVVVAFGWFFLTAWLQRRTLPGPGNDTEYLGLLRLPHDRHRDAAKTELGGSARSC